MYFQILHPQDLNDICSVACRIVMRVQCASAGFKLKGSDSVMIPAFADSVFLDESPRRNIKELLCNISRPFAA